MMREKFILHQWIINKILSSQIKILRFKTIKIGILLIIFMIKNKDLKLQQLEYSMKDKNMKKNSNNSQTRIINFNWNSISWTKNIKIFKIMIMKKKNISNLF